MNREKLSGNSGLTMVELLIALAIGSIVSAAIYTVHQSQVRGQIAQEAALEMQQGLRAALTIMEQEIRSAGTDPAGIAMAGIITATPDEFRFTRDVVGSTVDGMEQFNGDASDPIEDIRYGINTEGHLGRETGGAGGLQSICENVDALNFVYLNRAGEVMSPTVTGLELNDIRQVQVTIVARYGQSQRGMLKAVTDSNDYRNQLDEIILAAPNDTFRRLMMTTTITCRNTGLDI